VCQRVDQDDAGTPGANGTSGANGTGGTSGAAGTTGVKVRDPSGRLIGAFAGLRGLLASEADVAPLVIFNVLIDGGVYTYTDSGLLLGTQFTPVFTDDSCSGTAYVDFGAAPSGPAVTAFARRLSASTMRSVFRPITVWTQAGPGANFGPARVWKYTSIADRAPAGGADLWQLDFVAGCRKITRANADDLLVQMREIPAPADVPDGVQITAH
jgi:hypothetical protein